MVWRREQHASTVQTWQSVYHCAPKLEVTTSSGVDRTTLTLGFEGHQPDIEAMKLLYDNPDELIEVSDTPEGNGEKRNVPQNVAQTNGDVSLNREDVPQNVAQTEASVAQMGVNVAQMGVNVAQNLDDCIYSNTGNSQH